MPLGKIGTSAEQKVTLAEKTSVSFSVHADSYSYSGGDYVMLAIELLKDGKSVEKVSCRGFELEGGAGGGCQTTHHNSDCSLVVPAGGADTVRIATSMEDGRGTFEAEGLSANVIVH